MKSKISVLLIQNNLKTLSELTEKCLEAGISEKNIFSVSDSESAERYLEIAGISYIIVDANLYNYMVASVIDKFSEYFPIQVIINNSKPEHKTLRMLTDKSLCFIESSDELVEILTSNYQTKVSYPY